MSENNDTNPNTRPNQQPQEKAGDILRKERVTKRITVETIAKDLKLNVNYIKALEANNYDELPADPYVRVYLRSIATYLMLDPEDILRRFYRDRGIDPNEEKEEVEKIRISMSEKEKPSFSWVFALIAVAVLVGLTLFANQMGWINIAAERIAAPADTAATEESEEIAEEELPGAIIPDSLADTADTAAGEEVAPGAESSAIEPDDTLSLTISATRDSVWVQVFADGDSWRNFIEEGQTRVFTAADSFNVRVGNNSLLRYRLNGESLNIRGGGVVAFRVDHSGADVWTLSKWNSVFEDRM